MKLTYDLHIHSALSPCGDKDMTPYNIVAMASLKGLQVIALTDHNSCKNCPSFMKHGKEFGILTIPGMELCTREEVHVLILFPTLERAMEWDTYVESRLSNISNHPNIFGEQVIIDEDDVIIGIEKKLLIQATDISYFDLWDLIQSYDGVMIPAHIDKNSYSLLSNLGFIGMDSKFHTYEMRHVNKEIEIIEKNPYLKECLRIMNSDAHYLEDIKESEHPMFYNGVLEVEEVKIQTILRVLKGDR